MKLNHLSAISPIDGRYRSKVENLALYFSEFGLMKYRIFVELEYFIALVQMPLPQLSHINASIFPEIRKIHEQFNASDAQNIKKIETITNHDVKAIEYFIKEKFDTLGLKKEKEFIHFGLTSQDINNTAIPCSIKDAIQSVFLPALKTTIEVMKKHAQPVMNTPLLARTHGQPASPTTLGKEWQVFITRLNEQISILESMPIAAKFGGATGNFNAHTVAYPHIQWHDFGDHFIENIIGLKRSYPTTQIEHYDYIAALCDVIKRINTIFIDFSRDIWTYISIGYYKQKIKKNEIGSSAMPHKVNPIDFENAEGNLGLSNAIFNHLSQKLPISRLQRDLTDSTVLRNIGVPFSHSCIAFNSLQKGIEKLEVNNSMIEADLNNNWAVVAEAIQTILRRESYPEPYEKLKDLTRTNKPITKESIHQFIMALNLSPNIETELLNITPFNYIGQI